MGLPSTRPDSADPVRPGSRRVPTPTLRLVVSGGAATETVRFGLDGAIYEIDLSKENARQLRRAYRCYTTAGRRMDERSARGARPARTEREQSAEIRRWARGQGIPVKARGRLASSLVEQYRAAAALDDDTEVP